MIFPDLIKDLLNDTDRLLESSVQVRAFHDQSSIAGLAPRSNVEPQQKKWSEKGFRLPVKQYRWKNKISCIVPDIELPDSELRRLLSRRRTPLGMRIHSISNDIMFRIIVDSIGVNGINESAPEGFRERRPYPSAGATYPVETYVIANSISGLDSGLYHFNPSSFELSILKLGDLRDKAFAVFCGQHVVHAACFIVIFSAVLPRVCGKYSDRGYRFALIETGHICQNIALFSTESQLAATPLGGFFDLELRELLEIKSQSEVPLYGVAVGVAI